MQFKCSTAYRSFGDDLTKIAPLKKVNLIVGKNNVGKSNIIKFLNDQYEYFVNRVRNESIIGRKQEATFKEIDLHISKIRADHRISFPILKDEIDDYINQKLPDQQQHSFDHHRTLAKKILVSDSFSDENSNIWFTYKSSNHNHEFALDFNLDKIRGILENRDWYLLWNTLTHQTKGDINRHWIPETLRSLAFIPPSLVPNIKIIPAIRKIGAAGTEAVDFSGEGIIERLAKIQNPPLSEQILKDKFLAINSFVQEVLENKSAEIEIPYARDMILIHMDEKTLPLESLGTGVHEVVILAAAATLLENTILCVEEPELHLHPLLQKKLIRYLSENTNNQYFFTTHSAHLLDAVESEIFLPVNN
jgi:AAA15 family ATPase/GTPase